ncbi:MAG: hypothetical protein DELT_02611 [Desulfovibrio sp.]
MSKQKVVFLYCSPSGEAVLTAMLQEWLTDLTPDDGAKVLDWLSRAIYKSREGHSIRVWFGIDYSDDLPEVAFLKHFLAIVPETDIFFARFGEDPDDVEELGSYERINLPEAE